MNFDNYFDDRFVTNGEEDRLVDDLSYESTLRLAETLSRDDQLKLSLHLLENSIQGLSEDQWLNIISYLKCRKGIKSDDRIEQKRLDETYSRTIISASYEKYTPREMIVEYLNRYFDWQAEELDTLSPTTVFLTGIWDDFVKHVERETGWNERKVKRTVGYDYFKKYLMNYGTYLHKMMNKNEDLYQNWLCRAMLLARKEHISRRKAQKMLSERDPEGSKRAKAKTIKTMIKDLPTLREEWQTVPPNFVFKR